MFFHIEIHRIPIENMINFADQRMGVGNVVRVGGSHCDCMDVSCFGLRTGMYLHAEVPLIPLLGGVHLRGMGLFFVELGV